MPELAQVETPKTAGFVQSKGGSKANKRRIEESEAELKSLMEERNNESTKPNSKTAETTKVQDDGDSEQKEANAKGETQEDEKLSSEEKTYKKRYSDLRNHLNKQAEELKAMKEQLNGSGTMRPPTSDENIEAWANKYPEIAGIVETIAEKKAQEKFNTADERLKKIDEMNATAERTSAVMTKRTTKPDSDNPAGHIRESQVNSMTAQEYEANADEIMDSIRSGKFIYDISGGAR